jgi:hypothetical protein
MAHTALRSSLASRSRKRFLGWFALALIALYPRLTPRAENLDDIFHSPVLRDDKLRPTPSEDGRVENERHQRERSAFLRGIEPGSNFALIWSGKNHSTELLNWIGAKLPYYKYLHPDGDLKRDRVSAAVALSSGKKRYDILIVIPHPSIRPLVDARMLSEYRQFHPPQLQVISEKTVTLPTGSATLYIHKKGSASLFIPIEQSGLVQISTANSDDYETLIEIGKALDIERLNRKISS